MTPKDTYRESSLKNGIVILMLFQTFMFLVHTMKIFHCVGKIIKIPFVFHKSVEKWK